MSKSEDDAGRTEGIEAVVIVRDCACPVDQMVVVGEVPGPWGSEDEAVAEALLGGQHYRTVSRVIYAEDRMSR